MTPYMRSDIRLGLASKYRQERRFVGQDAFPIGSKTGTGWDLGEQVVAVAGETHADSFKFGQKGVGAHSRSKRVPVPESPRSFLPL
jgi:hypothetical protein